MKNKKTAAVKTQTPKPGRPLKDKTGQPETCAIGVKVSKETWLNFKKIAEYQEQSSSKLIDAMLFAYVKKHEKGLKRVEATIKTAFKN